jgi:glycosyltransferase involved in cell wall biosynthesis
LKTLHFDARFIRLDHHDGISRFSVELIKALLKKIHVVVIIHDLRQLDFLPKGIEFVLVNSPESVKEFWIARKLNKLGVTHVYSPMQVMGTFGRKYQLVITLHDLIYYRHRKPPQDLNLFIRGLWRLYHLSFWPQRLLLNRADAVVTVSETTKRLMVEHRLTKKPVTVVYNASSLIEQAKNRKFTQTRDLIYIGSFMPYKNVETLIRGVAGTNFTLHLLSKIDSVRQAQLEKLASSLSSKVVFHKGVSDKEYLSLIQNSFALVTASKDEGFGIPLVEAMGQGTPVVVSDLEIFHEVAGSAGHYFNPANPAELTAQLSQLADEKIWEAASKQALAQSAKFDWDKSAEELLEAFNQPRI